MSENLSIEDVQSIADTRNIAINKVGIKGLKHPIVVEDIDMAGKLTILHTIANFQMLVNLPSTQKGTHMSRFIELLNEQEAVFSLNNLPEWVDTMLTRLEASSGFLTLSFPFFIKKSAPISGVESFVDYEVTLKANLQNGKIITGLYLLVPITTLCPCSKKISDYGAHNQRSHVTIDAEFTGKASICDMITLIENEASCELYGVLKRPDEKYVTEKAYENPKFVEDLVRDISGKLNQLPNITRYKVTSENFESIHNHSAYAEIERLTSNK